MRRSDTAAVHGDYDVECETKPNGKTFALTRREERARLSFYTPSRASLFALVTCLDLASAAVDSRYCVRERGA